MPCVLSVITDPGADCVGQPHVLSAKGAAGDRVVYVVHKVGPTLHLAIVLPAATEAARKEAVAFATSFRQQFNLEEMDSPREAANSSHGGTDYGKSK